MKIAKLNRGEAAGLISILIFGVMLASVVVIGSEYKLFPAQKHPNPLVTRSR